MKTMDEMSVSEYESMVDFMREDLASGMMHSKVIQNCQTMFEEEGRDFDAEFKQWKKDGKPVFVPKSERTAV